MEMTTLPASKPPMPAPVTATRDGLTRRWGLLTDDIRAELGFKRNAVQIFPEFGGDTIWAGFVGTACELTERNRGSKPAQVVPILDVGRDGLKAWLGYQEIWDAQPRARFSFRSLSLTVHFGYDGDRIKPQVFRSEWSGIKDWAGLGMGFQSPGAGQPHWQFDLSESFRRSADISDDILTRLSERADEGDDFFSTKPQPDVFSAVRALTVERMHFASAARWWSPPGDVHVPEHMNAPSDVSGLSRWTLLCICYIKQELARCEIRRLGLSEYS
jgi:hypothetical protein